MTERALVASRSGAVTPWLEPVVEALGYEVAGTLVVDSPEHGELFLPPGLVERLADRIGATDTGYLAVDGHVHPGQTADLLAALPSLTLRDRRGVVYERLAVGGNGVAAALLELQERRTERRQAANESREAATEGPTGTAGRVEELERRCQRLRERLAARQTTAREAVKTGYGGVDARVALLGPPTAATTALWAGLTGAEPGGDEGALAPDEPATATTQVGAHEIAVTDTPGASEGLPEWFRDAVPGTMAALERADVVVLVGDDPKKAVATLSEAVAAHTDATQLPAPDPGTTATGSWETAPVDSGDPAAVRSRLARLLPSARVAVSLPYADDAHALVSWLHDRAAVESVEYGDEVALTVTVPAGAVAEVRRRIRAVDGEVEEPPEG